MKEKYHKAFMKMAEAFAETSEAVRLKVGCVLVKDGNIISLGVNGMASGWPTEVCEDKVYLDEEQAWLFAEDRAPLPIEAIEYHFAKYPYHEGQRRYRLSTKQECRHAEIAALEKMWNSHTTTQGSEMYITHSPCLNCCIKIKTAGITKVYYKEPYRCDKGLQFLKASGIIVEQLS